jgi:ABC-type proline/glycine betaine transport system permease subunit
MALGLLLVAVVLGLLDAKLRIHSSLSVVLRVSAVISAAIGFILGWWARRERWFLTRPDPERPPEIFNNKP